MYCKMERIGFILSHVSLILLLLVKESDGQCVPFNEVPEDEYEMTYSAINVPNARPLGYMRTTLVFDGNDLCYEVEGVDDGRGVEVSYESVPSAILCVRTGDGTELGCNSKDQHCSLATSDPTQFHFYLNVGQGSSESDVNFWVRVTKGAPAVNDTEGLWCQERSVSYPESLGILPDFVTPPEVTPISGTQQLTATTLLIALFVFISL